MAITHPKMLSAEDRAQLAPFTYDEWMLRSTAARLTSTPPDDVLRNALTESFLLHARALAEFFSQTGFTERDLRASRFVGHRPWGAVTSLKFAPVLQLLMDVSWEIAHITCKRTGLTYGRTWDVDEICDALKPHVDRFAAETGWKPYALDKPSQAERTINGAPYAPTTTHTMAPP